jgi:hypothetical protein
MLNPLITHMGQHLTQDLATEFDEKIVIRFPRIDAQDLAIVRSFIDTALRFNVMSIEEVRDLFGKLGVAQLSTTLPPGAIMPRQQTEAARQPETPQEETTTETAQAEQTQATQKRNSPHGETTRSHRSNGRQPQGAGRIVRFD